MFCTAQFEMKKIKKSFSYVDFVDFFLLLASHIFNLITSKMQMWRAIEPKYENEQIH